MKIEAPMRLINVEVMMSCEKGCSQPDRPVRPLTMLRQLILAFAQKGERCYGQL